MKLAMALLGKLPVKSFQLSPLNLVSVLNVAAEIRPADTLVKAKSYGPAENLQYIVPYVGAARIHGWANSEELTTDLLPMMDCLKLMQSSHALHEVDMELKLLISLNSVLHKHRNLWEKKNPHNLCSHTCLHNEMKDISEIVGHWILGCCQTRRMINLFFSNSVTQMTDYLITISSKYA